MPGQRIALIAPNGLAYLPAAFGLLATGACMVPLAGGIASGEVTQTMTEIQVNGSGVAEHGAPRELGEPDDRDGWRL
jgi:acyl-CoA synthetase (AMP-forming)/AMP-acid ligase II